MSDKDPLNARDLMVIIDALRSVIRCQGLGGYADTAYKTAWEKVFIILEGMEVPSSVILQAELKHTDVRETTE